MSAEFRPGTAWNMSCFLKPVLRYPRPVAVPVLDEVIASECDGWRPRSERFDDFEPTLDSWGDAESRPLGSAWRRVEGEWDDPTWCAVVYDAEVFVDLLEASAPQSKGSRAGWVYYLLRQGEIKIGTSRRPGFRAHQFGAGLLAVEPGGFPMEMRRHWEFAAFRTHGEWFRDVPEIRAHIASLRDNHEQFAA